MAAVTSPLNRIASACRLARLARLAFLALVFGATLGVVGAATPAVASSGPTAPTAPLRAPKTTDAQDTKFLTDVAEADPSLASYEQKQQNVALRALLTDGSAFCALLRHDANLDAALVDEASGARDTESQTHLPLSVTTFNTIESMALLTLCPSEQHLLPVAVRTKIRNLGRTLAPRAG